LRPTCCAGEAVVTDAFQSPELKPPTQRAGTKQAMLIALLRAATGTTMEAGATDLQAHGATGALSAALGKTLGA
jgi:hypothetical protein